MTAPLTPRALRTRWAVARLQRAAGHRTALPRPEPVQAMGLVFPTPLGFAAGFDRRGRLLEHAHRLGFGAIELGTFASPGSTGTPPVWRPDRAPAGGARCGVSLGKPVGVDWVRADDAFVRAFRNVPGAADYVTLNPGRDCPSAARFVATVAAVAVARDRAAAAGRRRLPIVAKLPSRWLAGDAVAVASAFVDAGADGLLVSAEGLLPPDTACAQLARLAAGLGPRRPCLISVGGIASLADVEARRAAGASLVQVHRALLAHRPVLLRALRARP